MANPTDRLIGHVFCEVIPIFLRSINNGDTIVNGGFPHIVFRTNKAVELFEALPRWPTDLRAGGSGLTAWCFMPLPERRCVVAIEPQNFCNWHGIIRHHGGIARITRCNLWDRSRIDLVVIAAGFQRRPRRRTQGCGVEFVVAQAIIGKLFRRRHVYRTAKGGGCCVAHIIEKNDHHVGGIGWCRHLPLRRQWHL